LLSHYTDSAIAERKKECAKKEEKKVRWEKLMQGISELMKEEKK
jgi:hypothetical protein